MTLHTQALTMFAMVASGIYLGFIYTSFQVIVYKWLKLAALTYILEILFGLSQAILIFYILFQINDGDVRLYVFLSLALGYSAYQVLFKQFYEKTLHRLEEIILKLWKHILQILHILIWGPLIWLFGPVWKILQKFLLCFLRPINKLKIARKRKYRAYITSLRRFLLKLFQNKGNM